MIRAAILILVLSPACTIHLDRNAPGNVALEEPSPANPGAREAPKDPGERVALVGVGGYTGIGFRAGEGSSHAAAEAGVELSLQVGSLETSHPKPDLIPVPIIPERRYGVNLGFSIIESTVFDLGRTEVGPLYLEAMYGKQLGSISAGYAFDPDDRSHGPQISASFFGIYVKSSYRFGRGVDTIFGMVIKLPTAIVWSQ